jgi:hypothetical protein
MSYRPATAAEILSAISERFLTAEGQELGEDVVLRIAREGALKVVDAFDIRGSSEVVVLAVVDRDETYFDSCDGKWEYCYTDYAVVASAAVVAEERALAAMPESWGQAVKAGYSEYV